MTAPYQVFVDGPRDRSPLAIDKLATAIGARYGLPPTELATRLARGRFKVKAGIDRATAEQYARDLERLGAACTIVDANGATVELAPLANGAAGATTPNGTAVVTGASTANAGASRSQTPRTGAAALPPRTTEPPRSQSSPLARAPSPRTRRIAHRHDYGRASQCGGICGRCDAGGDAREGRGA